MISPSLQAGFALPLGVSAAAGQPPVADEQEQSFALILQSKGFAGKTPVGCRDSMFDNAVLDGGRLLDLRLQTGAAAADHLSAAAQIPVFALQVRIDADVSEDIVEGQATSDKLLPGDAGQLDEPASVSTAERASNLAEFDSRAHHNVPAHVYRIGALGLLHDRGLLLDTASAGSKPRSGGPSVAYETNANGSSADLNQGDLVLDGGSSEASAASPSAPKTFLSPGDVSLATSQQSQSHRTSDPTAQSQPPRSGEEIVPTRVGSGHGVGRVRTGTYAEPAKLAWLNYGPEALDAPEVGSRNVARPFATSAQALDAVFSIDLPDREASEAVRPAQPVAGNVDGSAFPAVSSAPALPGETPAAVIKSPAPHLSAAKPSAGNAKLRGGRQDVPIGANVTVNSDDREAVTVAIRLALPATDEAVLAHQVRQLLSRYGLVAGHIVVAGRTIKAGDQRQGEDTWL